MKLKSNPTIFSDVLINNFGQIVNEMLSEKSIKPDVSYKPAVELSENNDRYMLQLSLPGVPKENIRIRQEDLIIKIEAQRNAITSDNKILHSEFNYGMFTRDVLLPKNANLDAISATFQEGILTVLVPKKEESKPKNISIT